MIHDKVWTSGEKITTVGLNQMSEDANNEVDNIHPQYALLPIYLSDTRFRLWTRPINPECYMGLLKIIDDTVHIINGPFKSNDHYVNDPMYLTFFDTPISVKTASQKITISFTGVRTFTAGISNTWMFEYCLYYTDGTKDVSRVDLEIDYNTSAAKSYSITPSATKRACRISLATGLYGFMPDTLNLDYDIEDLQIFLEDLT